VSDLDIIRSATYEMAEIAARVRRETLSEVRFALFDAFPVSAERLSRKRVYDVIDRLEAKK
jgi:hypothetical protein